MRTVAAAIRQSDDVGTSLAECLADRVASLESVFREIERTRLCGVPVCNAALRVQAVGFEDDGDGAALGVLITPWFMNLVRLPVIGAQAMPEPGRTCTRDVAGHRLDFIGAEEAEIGRYEACSLFSPMFEFADQTAAEATAREVLALLRPAAAPAVEQPTRRRFLLGRRDDRGAV